MSDFILMVYDFYYSIFANEKIVNMFDVIDTNYLNFFLSFITLLTVLAIIYISIKLVYSLLNVVKR